MKFIQMIYSGSIGLGAVLSLFSSQASLAESGSAFKSADCEFTEAYEDTAYKCSAELITCLRLQESAARGCHRQLIVYCDEGEMFKGGWKSGTYGKYHRFEGIMDGATALRPQSVTGPVLDIEDDAARGFPASLQIYGKTMKGKCSLYRRGDTPPPGINP